MSKKSSSLLQSVCGRGRSTAVEQMPRNLEVMGSNPPGYWAFSSSSFFSFHFFSLSLPTLLHQWSVLNQVPQ